MSPRGAAQGRPDHCARESVAEQSSWRDEAATGGLNNKFSWGRLEQSEFLKTVGMGLEVTISSIVTPKSQSYPDIGKRSAERAIVSEAHTSLNNESLHEAPILLSKACLRSARRCFCQAAPS